MVLCWQNFQSAIEFLVLADRQKSNSLYQPMIMMICMKFGSNLMKTVEGVVFRKLWNCKLCKMHRITPNQTQGIGHQKYQYPTYVHCWTPPPPQFSSVSLYKQLFARYFTFQVFPLTPMLKFQSGTKFLKTYF